MWRVLLHVKVRSHVARVRALELLRDGIHDGKIHAAHQCRVFSGQRIEGAIAQHDGAVSAPRFVPVLRQRLAGAGDKPVGA